MCVKYIWFYETIQDKSTHITFKHSNPIYKMYFVSQHLDDWVKTTSKHHLFLTKRSAIYLWQFHCSLAYKFNQWYRQQKKKPPCYSLCNQINGSMVAFQFLERYWNNEMEHKELIMHMKNGNRSSCLVWVSPKTSPKWNLPVFEIKDRICFRSL
jgi:hypothetical protein